MSQDYVRKARPARPKRKPASRPGRQPARAPFPVFRAVLALVLQIGFGVFLYILKGSAGEPKPEPAAAPQAKPIPIEDQRPAKEKFDYMTLLENKEVNVELPSGAEPTDFSVDPEQQKRLLAQAEAEKKKLEQARLKAQQQSGAAVLPQSDAERAAALLAGQPVSEQPTATPAASTAPAGRGYLMQCGAFRTNDQAASMKLRLAFQGHSAQVQQGQVNGSTWYKVILGPFASKAEAESQRAAMKAKHLVDNCTIWMK